MITYNTMVFCGQRNFISSNGKLLSSDYFAGIYQEDAAEEIAGMITQFVLSAKIHETDEGITARTDRQTESLIKKVAVLTTTTMVMAATMTMLLVISVPMALVRNGGVENVTCCRIVDNGWLCSRSFAYAK